MRNWFRDVGAVIFREECWGCGRELLDNERVWCLCCELQFPTTTRASADFHDVSRVFRGRFQFHQALSWCLYDEPSHLRELIHTLKYERRGFIGVRMGEMMGKAWGARKGSCSKDRRGLEKAIGLDAGCLPKSDFHDCGHPDLTIEKTPHSVGIPSAIPGETPEIVVPVPIHPKKKRTRGYNQSERIARGFSMITKMPVATDALRRKAWGKGQSKSGRLARWENVQREFESHRTAAIQNRHVLLVDDVITTGATLESCALQLYRGGARNVSILAVGYTSRKPH